MQDHGSETRILLWVDTEEACTTCQFTASGTTRQPTYTTVGSIYNPHATTPIQPPTRRPRTRRYQQPGQSPPGESSLAFANTLLSALPIRDTSPSSPTPGVTRPPEYSPLQQNYDRAVSPIPAPKPALQLGIGLSLPSIRSGNLPPPPALDFGLDIAEDDSQSSEEIEPDPLPAKDIFPVQRFTTKSLTSLASYPNPMQTVAKDALARARAANSGEIHRPDTPVLAHMSTDPARNRLGWAVPTTAGAPRPLTAGPPGQRQYRASTFEASFRALRLQPEYPPTQPRSPIDEFKTKLGFSRADTTEMDPIELDSARLPASMLRAAERSHSTDYPFGSSNPIMLNTSILSSLDFEYRPKKIYDTLSIDKLREYYRDGLPSNYLGRNAELDDLWIDGCPLDEYGFSPSPERIKHNESKINRKFYAGTERYIGGIPHVQCDYDHRRYAKNPGVIGGERHEFQKRRSDAALQGDCKIRPRHLSIEEANSMEDCVHAEPIINMAYASIVRWKEVRDCDYPSGKGWEPQFVEADPAWVDYSEEGNNSFFSQEKLGQPKKKRLVKKTRRGY